MYIFAFTDDQKLINTVGWIRDNKFPAWVIDWPTKRIKIFCKGNAEKLIKGLLEIGLSENNISIEKPHKTEGLDNIWQV